MSRVITFYSYKGGTGRSMALANVAWILATNGKRVLAIDWDLEAPGLHRYFHPFLTDKELSGQESQGVIDMALDFAVRAATPPESGQAPIENWHEPYADFSGWRQKLRWPSGDMLGLGRDGKGQIDFVPAGRQGPDYARRVNHFDWHNFYEKLGGGAFFDEAKSKFGAYDYVLIDSRTGVSDTSGICTVHMPDTLVVCFTLNHQSIKGALAVARSVRQQRPKMRIFPVPMRIDGSEEKLLNRMKSYAASVFTPLLEPTLNSEEYWYSMEVPYFARYAYAEKIALFEERGSITASTLPAMERLTAYLTADEVRTAGVLPESERARALAEFEGSEGVELPLQVLIDQTTDSSLGPVADVERSAGEPHRPLIVISYAYQDEPERPAEGEVKWLSFVTGYLRPLIKQGAADLWVDRMVPGGADWDREIERKLHACDVFVLLVSRYSLSSDYVIDKEIAIIRERQANGEAVHFFPLILTPTPRVALDLVRDKNLRPRDGKPLSDLSINERYRQMNQVADEIVEVASNIAGRRRATTELPGAVGGEHGSSEAPQPEDLPHPYPNVEAPFAYGWTASQRVAGVAGAHNLPFYPHFSSEEDHRRALEACRIGAERLLKALRSGRYNAPREYGEALEYYLDDLPKTAGAGNILLANDQIRILHTMFLADADMLPEGFTSRLKSVIANQFALNAFYELVQRHNEAVNTGNWSQPFPLDHAKELFGAVEDNTPRWVEPEVEQGLHQVEQAQPPPAAPSEPTPAAIPPPLPPGTPDPQDS